MSKLEENNDIKVYIKQDELEFDKLTVPNIDYTSYTNGGEMLTVLEDDATRWADAFAQFYKKKYEVDINVEFAFVWFANAIESGHDVKKRRELNPPEPIHHEDEHEDFN